MSETTTQHDCPRCRELIQRYKKRIADLEAQVRRLTELLEQSIRAGSRLDLHANGTID